MSSDSMSKPTASPPSQWSAVGNGIVWKKNGIPSGMILIVVGPRNESPGTRSPLAGIGRTGARAQAARRSPSQAIESQAPNPSFYLTMPSSPPSVAASRTSSASAPSPPSRTNSCVSSRSATVVSGRCSGMADPRVQDRVEDVDEDVHEHVRDRDHADEGLQRFVLPGKNGSEQQRADSAELEDHLDDDGATDERAQVDGGHGQQGERRR